MYKKNARKGLSAPVMTMAIMLFAFSLLLIYQDFFVTPLPLINGLKIVKVKDALAASYKKTAQAGSETICWYFNGVEQRALKGSRSIKVPAAFDRTVEVECVVRLNEGTAAAKEYRSKKYRYFSNKLDSSSPSNYSPLTTYEIQIAAAKKAGKTFADWSETAESETVVPPLKVRRSAGAEEFLSAIEKANKADESGAIPYEAASVYTAGSQASAPETPPAGNVTPQGVAAAESAAQPAGETPPPLETAAVAVSEDQNKIAKQPENLFGKKVEYFKSKSSAPPAVPGSIMTTATGTVEVQAVSSVTTVDSTSFSQSEKEGSTTMAQAIENRDYVYLQYLITSGRKVNTTDSKGRTSLHSAVSDTSDAARNFMTFLLRNNAEIRRRDIDGKTPLHIAVAKKNTAAVSALLEYEKSLPPAGTSSEEVRKNRLVNLTDNRGQTPLHAAAAYDAGDAASILIDNGAEVNAGDSNKSTPLHYAVLNKAKNAIAILIAAGADINARDKFEQTPLNFADNEIMVLIRPKTAAESKTTKKISTDKPGGPSIPRTTSENSIKKAGK